MHLHRNIFLNQSSEYICNRIMLCVYMYGTVSIRKEESAVYIIFTTQNNPVIVVTSFYQLQNVWLRDFFIGR